ncbi:hypothetical protein B9Z19DRAFT_1089843, partial [Tuber borchii]
MELGISRDLLYHQRFPVFMLFYFSLLLLPSSPLTYFSYYYFRTMSVSRGTSLSPIFFLSFLSFRSSHSLVISIFSSMHVSVFLGLLHPLLGPCYAYVSHSDLPKAGL